MHRGDSFYLAHTIAQARQSNPDSKIILLGDRSNAFYSGVEHHYYDDYFETAREFTKKYVYDFFPTYQYPWILFCHQKYFFLNEFCNKHSIKKYLIIDTDVLIYDRIEPYFDYFSKYKITVSGNPNSNEAQASFTLVLDHSIIQRLCDIYNNLFSTSAEELRKRYGFECFTEMFGLNELLKHYPDDVKNTFDSETDFHFNHSVESDSRFEYENKFLKIYWNNNLPYFKNIETGVTLKSPHIHFHGKGKYRMKNILKISSLKISLEHLLNRVNSIFLKYPKRIINKLSQKTIYPAI